jgi:hypothetical protein
VTTARTSSGFGTGGLSSSSTVLLIVRVTVRCSVVAGGTRSLARMACPPQASAAPSYLAMPAMAAATVGRESSPRSDRDGSTSPLLADPKQAGCVLT